MELNIGVNRTITTKQQSEIYSPKMVTISMTDRDATDSSSDDDNYGLGCRKMKRYVRVIEFEPNCCGREIDGDADGDGMKKKKKKQSCRKKEPAALEVGTSTGIERKFRGVRRRRWGRWSAEIRDSARKTRIWLGTFDTALEAALVYDHKAIALRGPQAQTNILEPPPLTVALVITPAPVSDQKQSKECLDISSPTSVLRFGKTEETTQNTWTPTQSEPLVSNPFLNDYLHYELDSGNDDFFDFRIASPIILEEVNFPVEISVESGEILSELNGDIESFVWDVDSFFQDPLIGE